MSGSDTDFDVDRLVGCNPGVDRDLLDRATEAVAELRRAGFGRRPQYGIDSPYERRPAERPLSVAEDSEEDDDR